MRLVYDCKGAIVSSGTCPRAVGTTVAVGELFKPLPVRHRVSQQVLLMVAPSSRGLEVLGV